MIAIKKGTKLSPKGQNQKKNNCFSAAFHSLFWASDGAPSKLLWIMQAHQRYAHSNVGVTRVQSLDCDVGIGVNWCPLQLSIGFVSKNNTLRFPRGPGRWRCWDIVSAVDRALPGNSCEEIRQRPIAHWWSTPSATLVGLTLEVVEPIKDLG